MKTEIISIQKISDAGKRQLFDLFSRFFANTDYDRFLADLSEKHWLIRMQDGDRLAGFSTQLLLEQVNGVDNVRFLFSGDTIVHPDYWNKSHLAGAFVHLFLRIAAQYGTPLYWFLISKGFRTYRFLPIFFRHFHPHYDGADADMKPLLDAVAMHKFGKEYNANTGLIEYEGRKDYLIADMADIPPSRRTDPHVLFFERNNPSYRCGTELACIAPLYRENLTRCGLRVLESTKVEWDV